MLNGIDLQRQTLRLHGELVARQESWAGQLVFACGEGVSATGLPAAVNIAGGTSLLLDPDAAAVKSVFRAGGVDFVVNTLDEALRVLKNEIRKHRPLSVVLAGAQQSILDEMTERGVFPNTQVMFDTSAKFPASLHLQLATGPALVNPTQVLRSWLQERGWSETALERTTMSGGRELHSELLELVSDPIRQTWVQRIGHYQRTMTNGSRAIWLTEAEREALSDGERTRP